MIKGLKAVKKRIREIRYRRDISQEGVSEFFNKSRTWFGALELSNRPIYEEEIKLFAKLFDMTVKELCADTGYIAPVLELSAKHQCWYYFRPLATDRRYTAEADSVRDLFSYNLARLMKKKNVSCGYIAAKMKVQATMVVRWRKGSLPNNASFNYLCEFFKCDYKEFFKRG